MPLPHLSYPFILLYLLLAFPVHAETNVTGQYEGGTGNQVTVQLTISAPPPAAFIVLLDLPPGVQLVNATPAPSGLKGQQVKWLFKHPRPGMTTISMHLSKTITVNRLQGEIRFSHPKSGKMFTKRIQ